MRIPENIAVAESVHEVPSPSIHHRSQQMHISDTSLRRILHKVWYDAIQRPIGSGVEARRFTEDDDFGKKKKSFFKTKLILILAGNIAAIMAQKTARIH